MDTLTHLASAALTACVPVQEPPRRRSGLGLARLGGEIVDGLRWTYRHRTLAPHALSTHGWFVCNSVLGAVVAPYALVGLGLSPFQLGLVMAATGVGGLVGALLAVPVGTRLGAGPVVILARMLTPVAIVLMLLAPDGRPIPALVLMIIGQLVFGLELGVSNANEMGYRQAVTPDELQGRMNTTIRSVNRAMVVIGAPLAGLLADAVGFRPTLAGAAVGFALTAFALWASPFRNARHTVV